jgi:hypothetical protein
MQHAVLTSILGPKALVDRALSADQNGVAANRVVVRQWIPYGATAWATSERGPWQELNTLPQEWGLRSLHSEEVPQ